MRLSLVRSHRWWQFPVAKKHATQRVNARETGGGVATGEAGGRIARRPLDKWSAVIWHRQQWRKYFISCTIDTWLEIYSNLTTSDNKNYLLALFMNLRTLRLRSHQNVELKTWLWNDKPSPKFYPQMCGFSINVISTFVTCWISKPNSHQALVNTFKEQCFSFSSLFDVFLTIFSALQVQLPLHDTKIVTYIHCYLVFIL